MSKVIKYNERVTVVTAFAVELVEGQAVTKELTIELKGNRSEDMAQRIIDREYKDTNVRPLVQSVDVKVIQHEMPLDKFMEMATATPLD